MKVIEKCGERGRIERNGVVREVSFALLPEIEPGEYVLIHAGYAIERLDQKEAQKTLELLQEIIGTNGSAGDS